MTRIDPELLAAFLENRLAPAERENVLERIRESDETYDVLVEAAAITDDLGAARTRTIPGTAARRAWSTRWRWGVGAVAAAAVLLVVLRPSGDATPQRVLEELTGSLNAGALPEGWLRDIPAADVERGPGELSEEAVAFRVGARLVDVTLAARRGSEAELAGLLSELSTLLENPSRANALQLRALSDSVVSGLSPAGIAPAVSRAAASAGRLLPRPQFIVHGMHIESGRLAAASGDASFFDSDRRRALVRALSEAGLTGVPAIEAGELEGDDLVELAQALAAASDTLASRSIRP